MKKTNTGIKHREEEDGGEGWKVGEGVGWDKEREWLFITDW